MNVWHVRAWASAATAVAMATAAACGGTSSGAGTGGEKTSGTGAGGHEASGTGTGGGKASAATGTGGGAGTGGGGGCLAAATYASLFTIADKAFCAVAMYEADEALGYQAPSWGSHHGPLTVVPDATGGGVTLERWTAPAGATGMLTKTSTHVAAGIPTGAYLGAQANDLPFFGWTAISWTGPSPSTAGQIVLIAGGSLDTTYGANGPYALAGVAAGATNGRLFYSGLSPLGASSQSQNGLYAADACASPMPELGAGTGCSPSALVDAWDENSGPVAVDRDGDVFAVLTSSSADTQEARGFAAAKVAQGAPPTKGVTLFTLPGYGSGLAAIAPSGSDPGVLVFQPFDGTTFSALNVVEQRYTVSGDVAASGAPATLLEIPAKSPGFYFMTDDTDRLWVASPGMSTTTYVVLDRKL